MASCPGWGPSLMNMSALPTQHHHKSTCPTSSSLYSCWTSVTIFILRQFRLPWTLLPITGKIPAINICSAYVCLSVLTNCLYVLTMAIVPSLSALWVPPEICDNLVFQHIHAASIYTICRWFVPLIYCTVWERELPDIQSTLIIYQCYPMSSSSTIFLE